MKKNLFRYIIFGIIALVVLLIVWYFRNIVTYILVSVVLALIGEPVVKFLSRIKLGKFYIPKALCAAITLILIWAILSLFFIFYIPLIVSQANELSTLNVNNLINDLQQPIAFIEKYWQKFNPTEAANTTLTAYISGKLSSFLNISMFTSAFSSLATFLENAFIAFFAISFITFFFLKDRNLFAEGITLFVPEKHEQSFREALGSAEKLLKRYFLGILLQISGIICLVTSGLTIAGIEFRHSIVIGLFAGIINVIPYVGPLIGTIFGIFLGIVTHLDYASTQLLILVIYMLIVFVSVHIIDNILFQPIIYSSSVHAHPLEIFLVIMVAGSLAGIIGMIIAVPSYTVLRVFAKEFFNNFKLVKKLTRKI
jgi:predicted PurR-regulated permease PerM